MIRLVLRSVAGFVVLFAILMVIWWLAVKAIPEPPTGFTVARTPQDVWHFLFNGTTSAPDAAANRTAVLTPLKQTLGDAGLGFVAGLGAAIVLAIGMVLSRGVEAGTMPIAMVLRSVPLIALAPILTMMFGNGAIIAAVMAGIVVLFPALVNIVFGLRSVSPQMADIVTVYGGNSWVALRRVAFPAALPSIFAALRISVPGAMTGALLAEALATGKGLGYDVAQAAAQLSYDTVWAMVVVTTVVSLALYFVAQLLERLVLARFGQSTSV